MVKLSRILKERVIMMFTDPDFCLIRKLIELEGEDKMGSLRARAITNKLIKRGYSLDLILDAVYGVDEDSESFDDCESFEDALLKRVSKNALLLDMFRSKKPSNT